MNLRASSHTHRTRPVSAPTAGTHGATCAAQQLQTRLLKTLIDAAERYAADASADNGGPVVTAKVSPERIRVNMHTAVNLLCDVRSRADDLAVDRCATPPHHRAGPAGRTLVTAAAHLAMEHLFRLPAEAIIVEIRPDAITLIGEVRCAGDRLAAEVAISYLTDQLRVDNRVRVLDPAGRDTFVGSSDLMRIENLVWFPMVAPFVTETVPPLADPDPANHRKATSQTGGRK